MTVGVTKLAPDGDVAEQVSMFDLMGDAAAGRDRRERLEAAVEALRVKHGDGSITLGYQQNEDIGLTREKE